MICYLLLPCHDGFLKLFLKILNITREIHKYFGKLLLQEAEVCQVSDLVLVMHWNNGLI